MFLKEIKKPSKFEEINLILLSFKVLLYCSINER